MESKKRDKRENTGRSPSADRAEAHGAALLLDRALPAGSLHEWTERVAARHKTPDTGAQSVVIFRIGAERLALPTRIVREIAEDCPFHSLPHQADPFATGLVNVRGEVLVYVSLETLLGLEREPRVEERERRHTHACVAVVDQDGDRFAFPLYEACGVVRYHPRELKEVPATLARATAAYTIGLLPWQGYMVGCLDAELLFYAINRSLA